MRYWRQAAKAQADVLYAEAFRLRTAAECESDIVVRLALRALVAALVDRAAELERTAAEHVSSGFGFGDGGYGGARG